MPPASTFPLPLAAALLSLLAAGCDSCRASKPYTPYTLADDPSAAPSAPSPAASSAPQPEGSAAASAEDAGPLFPAVLGALPTGDGKSWLLEGGVTVNAPVGRTFGMGLLLDVDGDGKRDLLAWARAPDGLRGELWFAPSSKPDAARTIAAIPHGLAAPGCSVRTDLAQVGARIVLADFEPRCGAGGRDKAIRWVAVLRLPAPAAGATPEIGMEFRFNVPAEGESFQIAVNPRDRDGDGRDDVTATVTLSGAPNPFPTGPSSSVALAFLDRPAGLSRDPSEPEASFKALTTALVADARRKTTASRIAAAAPNLRRLYTLLCEEAGKPRITTTAGPVRCGAARLIEETAMAEIEAALNFGDPIGAMAGLARLEAIGVRRKDVDALLAKNVLQRKAAAVYKTTAAPQIEPGPAYSPLAFDSNGDLLVRTQDKAIRVERASFNEAPVTMGAPTGEPGAAPTPPVDAALRWPTKLGYPAENPAWRLSSVERRCDEPTLIAHFETPRAGAGSTLDLPLPVPASPRCSPAPRVAAELLGTSSQGAVLAMGADLVAISLSDVPRPAVADTFSAPSGAVAELGAARSPDGATVAIPTVRGLLVATVKAPAKGAPAAAGPSRSATAKLWTGLDPAASFCVPSNGGARVACVTQPSASIYEAK